MTTPPPVPALEAQKRALEQEVLRVSKEGGGTVHLVLHVGPSLAHVPGKIRVTTKLRGR